MSAATDIQRPRTEQQDPYTAQFDRLERQLASRGPHWLPRLRRAAIASFGELGLPTPRNEDWKFTNVAHLTKEPFTFSLEGTARLDKGVLADHLFDAAVARGSANAAFPPRPPPVARFPPGQTTAPLAVPLPHGPN